MHRLTIHAPEALECIVVVVDGGMGDRMDGGLNHLFICQHVFASLRAFVRSFTMAVVTSSAGLLSLLSEDDERLKLYALQHLDTIVHEFWFQISSAITAVEQLYEDQRFSHRPLAALVASKVYYYLGELRDALDYALGAGELFDINDSSSEYVKTLLSCALDLYFENQAKEEASDPRLVEVVERLLRRCCEEKAFEQAVGIALEARRLDLFRAICHESPRPRELLAYALRIAQRLLPSKAFRRDVLVLLVELYETMPQPDWSNVCHCLSLLKQPEQLARILMRLLKGTTNETLLAYQIGFDLVENEVQKFIKTVQETLAATAETTESTEPAVLQKRVESLKSIISGRATIKLHLDFLYR